VQAGHPHTAPEDVEKLQEQLLEVRAQRKRVEAEFDAFTKGFRTGQSPEFPRVLIAPAPAGRARTRAEGGIVSPVAEAEAPHAAPAAAHTPADSRVVRRVNVNRRVLAVAGIAVVLGGAAMAVRDRGSQPVVETPVATQPAAPATVETPAPASTPATRTPPAPAQSGVPGVNLTLITRRRAWMRVTIDGQRAFEREVGPGEQIPLRGDRSIVVRAGDAGAVAVIWNGRDAGSMGRDGVVATREFTRDAASR
jgi:Domain of unknown function (DUF4115)